MPNLFKKDIIIIDTNFNAYHRSTVFKYKENTERTFHPNEKLSYSMVLWLFEQEINDFINFTAEENSLLKERLAYQCVRFNLTDAIYYFLKSKSHKNLKDPTYYTFITAKLRMELNKLEIPYKRLSEYHYVREIIDGVYIQENNSFRTFYLKFFLDRLNKAITTNNSKIKPETDTNNTAIAHLQKDVFIRFMIKNHPLPIVKAKKVA